MNRNSDKPTGAPARYGAPGRDPAERPPNARPWLQTEEMPAAWGPLFANADPSGLDDEDIEAAERAEARYAAEGYTFSGTAYGPHDTIENTDVEGRPLDVHTFDGVYEGVFGDMQTLVWANAEVLEADLAAGRRPYHIDGAEYLLDAATEKTAWLPACWWRLVEHGAWKASDFDDEEEEERWGRECALEVFATLYIEGWTPVRRLGNGYVERNERFRGHEGELTPYLMRYGRERKEVPPIDQDG